ncbi:MULTISPECIES: hypothetical protein [unclassified Microbacterium]|uniref:hypothetical protein n=1 Tax=unclassified Microbacterium TaxID=2609290 RepID=UPI0011B0846A|nr:MULTISPECIES: hypothetical protein [unclassified Microbacterium]
MKSKKLGTILASLALAGGMLIAGGAPAYAGSCSAVKGGTPDGTIAASCTGTVTIWWKCSSDLTGYENKKKINFGTGSSQVFKGCDRGFARQVYYSN